MNDLISRAALLKECNRRQETDPMEDGRGWADHFLNNAQEPSTEWMCVEAMIENMPAVDAAPVVHARWIASDKYKGFLTCSNCTDTYVAPEWLKEAKWRYCPQCGARMDETEGE